MNDRADHLAAALHDVGVEPGDFVPLVMRNGPELPVAMLAAMKLGAPFVPIDAADPEELCASRIGVLDPKVVLCSALPAAMPPGTRSLVVDVSAPTSPAGSEWRRRPVPLDTVAYGFYTTGSTATPKCALNTHLGLLNRFLYMSRRFGGGRDDVVLQNSRHVFDSSLWQLLWPLTTGSRVVIPDRTGILDLAATIDVIERHRVTMTDFVPSVFNMLVAMIRTDPSLAARMTSLRRVLIGGEEANPAAVRAFRTAFPAVAIINTYGHTEAAIGSVFHEITDGDTDTVPIGRPIDNTYAVVVDGQRRPVAAGEVGEILLGGDCLGLGYLNDPERTRAAFVANPFPDIPGDRLYRTGDLGCRGDDGLLYFSGREDQQVKISGVRIELTEIELILGQHPLVDEAKVVVRDGPGGKWLVAFVVGAAPDPQDLRAYAAAKLAPGLVPKDLVVLERMPLNANGKADRRQLSRIAGDRQQAARDAVPFGETERAVRRIWLDLLPVPPSAPSDDFFELGGESLGAHRLAIALSTAFGTAISVRDIAEAPTVMQQASLVTGTAGPDRPARWRRVQLDEDARLPADYTLPDPAPAPTCRAILLTGSTGFVGAQILSDLLTGTAADVYCLVRADDARSAYDRVRANLARYRLPVDEHAGRIYPLCGDLAKPRLGLDRRNYRHLARAIDTVVHAGALVNLAQGYAIHRGANVTAVAGILEFAAASRRKHVHHFSTLSAVVDRSDGQPIAEGPVSPSGMPDGGYNQSKWVGERLLQQAADRGLPVTVHRLGEVVPHSVTGVPSPRGFADLLVRACVQTGLCFTSSIVTDCTPVDWASRVVTAAVRRGEVGYFHVRHPQPVAFDDLLGGLRREFDLAAVCYPEFWHALRALADERPADGELERVLMLIPRADGADAAADVSAALARLFSDGTSRSDTRNTDRLMADAGIGWPALTDEVFRRYAAYHRGSSAMAELPLVVPRR